MHLYFEVFDFYNSVIFWDFLLEIWMSTPLSNAISKKGLDVLDDQLRKYCSYLIVKKGLYKKIFCWDVRKPEKYTTNVWNLDIHSINSWGNNIWYLLYWTVSLKSLVMREKNINDWSVFCCLYCYVRLGKVRYVECLVTLHS